MAIVERDTIIPLSFTQDGIDGDAFTVQSNLELPADQFDVSLRTSDLFRTASPRSGFTGGHRVTLESGLAPIAGSPALITLIDSGIVDEYVLEVRPDQIKSRIKGRDQIAVLLEQVLKVRFQRSPVPERIETFTTAPPTTLFTGQFLASDVARTIAGLVGLDLQWEVRDYILVEDFDATGKAFDIIMNLVRPWTLADPLKADIFMQGTTILVRHRNVFTGSPPEIAILTPDLIFDVADARISNLTIRKRQLDEFGRVLLEGRRIPQSLTKTPEPGGAPGGFIFGGGVQTVENFSEHFADGQIVSRIVSQDTYRMPDRLMIRQTKETFADGGSGLILTDRETIENDFESSIYDDTGPINQPKQRGQELLVESNKLGGRTIPFQAIRRILTSMEYDNRKFLKSQSTLTRELNLREAILEQKQLTIKEYRDKGPLFVEETTSIYRRIKRDELWTLDQRDVHTSAGHRPGGPGRGGTGPVGPSDLGADSAETRPITLEATISTAVDAVDIQFSNPHMELDDLNFILDQLRAASGVFEFELSFTSVAMTFLKRGTIIEFTGLEDENGDPILLDPAIVIDVRLTHRENGNPGVMTNVTAFFWKRL